MILPAMIAFAERAPTPDALTRAVIRSMVAGTASRLRGSDEAAERAFLDDMRRRPIASHVEDANAQHYEVPAAFFDIVLGPRRKYSCCCFADAQTTLAQAEEAALAATVERAGLADGMRILELGCGWGSLTLFMAERFPNARIVAVSNSASQRAAILSRAAERGLANVEVVTADMNDFATAGRFDRIVSIEMFEHMSNWRTLLARCRRWLADDGRLFLHVFTHARASYRFDPADRSNWIAQHFFTGGVMPAHSLARRFPDLFEVEAEWRWSGEHYARTAAAWLANFDAAADRVEAVLTPVYGRDVKLWMRRWRWFFLATEGLFGHAGGAVWGVGHYRLRPV
ncbi:MAG: class I SAM-dependent methyltransferase [Methylobacteriaceae bacterium]|nr:class I SAM-dependent methyltransferase [Methylobacteriaceae bacterium]